MNVNRGLLIANISRACIWG